MNYVESLNLFGTEAKEIPCTKGKGAPTNATKGAVGCLYMDTNTGDIYRCTALSGTSCIWKKFVEEEQVISKAESKLNNQYANAIKDSRNSGEYSSIRLTEDYANGSRLLVSPLEHDIIVKLRRRNFYNCEWESLEDDCGVTLTHAGGKTILNGTVDEHGLFITAPLLLYFDGEDGYSDAFWAAEILPLFGKWVFSIQSLGGMISQGELRFEIWHYEDWLEEETSIEGRIYKNTATGKLEVEYDRDPYWDVNPLYNDVYADSFWVNFYADEGTVFDNLSFACQWENSASKNSTRFTPFISDLSSVTVRVNNDPMDVKAIYTPDETGTCVIKSSDLDEEFCFIESRKSGVILEVEFCKDLNVVIEELTNAIIILGGNE